MSQVIIIGGGLAGLVSSILLSRNGLATVLIEKKKYPFHRVCGEYISNEVVPFMKHHGLYPDTADPIRISKFTLTAVNGREAHLPLDLGGFGISRYRLDHFLFRKATASGVQFLNTTVNSVSLEGDRFRVATDHETLEGDVVIGAFGKRSKLDKALDRSFIKRRSPYIGVKYHIEYNRHPDDTVALHNFPEGYCGISRIEEGRYNLCYLSERTNLKDHGQIPKMEEQVLSRNPWLEDIFSSARFLFDKPEVINEISFETKRPVEHNILMCGDAAGMITPLCGNGMAIAIHSAKLAAETVTRHLKGASFSRDALEMEYAAQWNAMFKTRLWAGRQIQQLFGAAWLSNAAVGICRNISPLANYLMKKTHGKPFR